MGGTWKQVRDVVVVVFLLALPFFLLGRSLRVIDESTNPVAAVLGRLVSPIERLAALLSRGVSSVVGDYVYLFDVKQDNDRLIWENARLRARVRELEANAQENERLRRLLALKDDLERPTVTGVVVAKNTVEYFRVADVVLDVPAAVTPNMPVLAADGVVGKVRSVSGDRATVQLTVDSGFGVDVVVERTGARGFVRGTGAKGNYSVQLQYTQRDDEVAVGDLFVTSGYGCRFPARVPVARVTQVIRREFGEYQTVEAEPTVDFSRISEVLVVLGEDEDCAAGQRPDRGPG